MLPDAAQLRLLPPQLYEQQRKLLWLKGYNLRIQTVENRLIVVLSDRYIKPRFLGKFPLTADLKHSAWAL